MRIITTTISEQSLFPLLPECSSILGRTDHYSSSTGPTEEERQPYSLETSRTTTRTSGNSSSQFVATLNTPHQQLRFEYHQREVELGHREKQIQLREVDIDLKHENVSLAQREVALALREAETATKERLVEESAARTDLISIFGIEGSKGIDHNLRNFTLFEVRWTIDRLVEFAAEDCTEGTRGEGWASSATAHPLHTTLLWTFRSRDAPSE